MAQYSNFNVKDFENLRTRSESVFSSMLENVRAIRNECYNMSDIVISDDSNLGMRWRNLYDSMENPINNIEDTFVIVKTLLDQYIENTIANEEAAVKEMEAIDTNITSLSSKAETLLTGLMSLRGIGFGASAIMIPGLHFMEDPSNADGNPGGGVNITPEATDIVEGPDMVVKYAPPGPVVPEPTDVTIKYAPPGPPEPEMTIKYAPPGPVVPEPTMTIKYAPPGPPEPEMTIKYAPPGPTFPEPDVTIKYAPPSWGEPIAVTKYAPPNFMDSKIGVGTGTGGSAISVTGDVPDQGIFFR